MLLRGRVGRHTRLGGRQCQNWADDQKKVTEWLRLIPWTDGGAAGAPAGADNGLDEPIHSGISSYALYRAISRFEDLQFPGQRSGFIDPDGGMIKRISQLLVLHNSVEDMPGESIDDKHRDWIEILDYSH